MLAALVFVLSISPASTSAQETAGASAADSSEADSPPEVPASCGEFDFSQLGPGGAQSASAWTQWWKSRIRGQGRQLVDASPRTPSQLDDSFWLVVVECYGTTWLWGIEVSDGQGHPRFFEKIFTQYCCGAEGTKAERIERSDFDRDGLPEFVVHGRWEAGGGVDYKASGQVSILVFPDRRLVRDWKEQEPPELDGEFEREGRTQSVSYDMPNWAVQRYNPTVRSGKHAFAVTREGSYNNDRLFCEGDRGAGHCVQSHFCRRVRTRMPSDGESSEAAMQFEVRQTILAPAGQGSCGAVLFLDESAEKLWAKSRAIGSVTLSFHFGEDRVHLEVVEAVDENHGLGSSQ